MPVLLADLQSLIYVVFFIIAFIGWIANLFNQNQPPAKNRPPQKRPPVDPKQRDVIQNEIDQFLNQTRRAPQRPQAQEPATPQPSANVERPAPPPRRPPAEKQRSKREVWEEQVGKRQKPPQRYRAPKPPQPQPASLREPLAEQQPWTVLGQSGAGSLGSQATPLSAGGSLPEATSMNLGTAIGGLVRPIRVEEAKTGRSPVALGLLQSIRTPQGIRDAVLLNEILSKPLAMRGKK